MYFDEMCDNFPKGATLLFNLLSHNSLLTLSLDMRFWYCLKTYWIRIPAVQIRFIV